METWNEQEFVGDIRVFDEEKDKKGKEQQTLDDYDARHKIGGSYKVTRSRFEREEM